MMRTDALQREVTAPPDEKPRFQFAARFLPIWEEDVCPTVVAGLIAPCLDQYKPETDSFMACIDRRASDDALREQLLPAMLSAYKKSLP